MRSARAVVPLLRAQLRQLGCRRVAVRAVENDHGLVLDGRDACSHGFKPPDLLTDRQTQRLTAAVFNIHAHVAVEAPTWGICQRIIPAYRDPNRRKGTTELAQIIETLQAGVPPR